MTVLQKTRHFSSAAKLVGAMRAFRLHADHGPNVEVDHLVSQFIGPFVFCFAAWVLAQAQKSGIKRLYFLSRDCQIAWAAACHLSRDFGDIDCRYLYVSRQALYLPTAKDISEFGMPWMRREGEHPVLKNLLAKIELQFQDVHEGMADLTGKACGDYKLNSKGDWKRFWSSLNRPPIKERIFELIQARKETTQSYFAQQGLLDDEPWAIVDLGWYLTGQKSIQFILNALGRAAPIHGFYLALKQGRVCSAEAGVSQAMFYEPPHDFAESRYETNIYYSQTLLEHVIGMADHPSVHHYEILNGTAKPVFQDAIDKSDFQTPLTVRKSVVKFIEENRGLAKEFQNEAFCQDFISIITETFFLAPVPTFTTPLTNLYFSGDQNGLGSKPLIQKAKLSYLISAKNSSAVHILTK